MSAPPAPSHDCLSLSLSVLGLCVLYHIWHSVCVAVILWLSFISGVCLFPQWLCMFKISWSALMCFLMKIYSFILFDVGIIGIVFVV